MDPIQIIVSQTTYSREEALKKLELCNGNYMKVIKDFMGIPEKKETIKASLNQEIFRQLRYKLDESMNTYNKQNPIDLNKVIENFAEEDAKHR
jgi:hypothetical protein